MKLKNLSIVISTIFILLFLSGCTNWSVTYTGDYCADNLQDRTETDVDCGGLYCDPCEEGYACEDDSDCSSENCESGLCATETYDATTADSDNDGVVDASDVCDGEDDTIDVDEDEIADCVDDSISTAVLPCTENVYLGESLSDCASFVDSQGTFIFTQDDNDAPSAEMYLFMDYSPVVYIIEGDSVEDSISENTVTVSSIENDDYEDIEFVAGSISAEIRFKNEDGRLVELPLAADSSFTSGEASDEAIFWGNEAPSSTTANQDELVYLEGERCQGDCQGAMFLVITDGEAHLIQITNIDTTDDEISFDDLTYGTMVDEYMIYTDGSVSDISLGAGDIQLLIDEGSMSVTFTAIGSNDGAIITTKNGATVTLLNTDTTSQIFEGYLFSEYDDGARDSGDYLSDFEITAVFDDRTDNSIEFASDSLGTSEGFGLYDESDINDDFQKFMTWKGTILTFDIEDRQAVVIEHSSITVYAIVSLE